MADFFRVQLGIVARSAGHSAAKRSAYQSCGRIVDHLGQVFDFGRKAQEHALPTLVLAPDDAPTWCADPDELWRRAAAAEKRVDAQEARIVDFSLPRQVPRHLWEAAARFVYEPFRERGMVVQVDIHDTPASDGGRNVNIHGLATLRRLSGDGFARKKERAWNEEFRERDGRAVRELVAERLTDFCRRHDLTYAADARPNRDRGLSAPEPTLPRWNWSFARRTGTPTAAVAGLHQHRRRRLAWADAVRELAQAVSASKALLLAEPTFAPAGGDGTSLAILASIRVAARRTIDDPSSPDDANGQPVPAPAYRPHRHRRE
ncbi:hypothetical protein GCM10011390_30610 [Aureimonas endophytica]|uniref:MobA/MobL protein domain-containing protein n=1 Tax=Aureimonas endophytica TaxID=2027858 RepID=A0A916ZQR8_9HYPH|nr:MobA/MobL family protein [Aureimonas endophytica]GGE09409.1 hypothetical protein GCM10011390_30610 [Aureimonas endophytica]